MSVRKILVELFQTMYQSDVLRIRLKLERKTLKRFIIMKNFVLVLFPKGLLDSTILSMREKPEEVKPKDYIKNQTDVLKLLERMAGNQEFICDHLNISIPIGVDNIYQMSHLKCNLSIAYTDHSLNYLGVESRTDLV